MNPLGRWFATVLAICPLLGACRAQRNQDRPFRTATVETYEDGQIRKGCLLEEASFQGHPARKGSWVHFYPSGAVDGLQLAREHTIAGRSLPERSTVWFLEDGSMKTVWLAEDRTYDGVPCDGGWGKVATGFYPDGGLRSAFLSRDAVLQGLPCRSSVFRIVTFHPGGQLAGATLSGPATYRGLALRGGDRVQLDPDGNLIDAVAGR